MSDSLRQRIAAAITPGHITDVDLAVDAVMAVVQRELADAYNEFGKALEVEAANTAREIDRAKQAEAEADQLRAALNQSDEASRRMLDRDKTLAAERYEWQERALAAEAEVERLRAELERLKDSLVSLDLESDAVIGTCGTAFGLGRWIGRPFTWRISNGLGRGETTVRIEIRPRGDA